LKNFSQKFIEVKYSHLTSHIGQSNSLKDIYNYKKYPFWVECSKLNEVQCTKILNHILLNSNNNDIDWVDSLLTDTKSRLARYNFAITDGGSRYFGYWRMKKIINFFRSLFN
jgi:hypothetical protein